MPGRRFHNISPRNFSFLSADFINTIMISDSFGKIHAKLVFEYIACRYYFDIKLASLYEAYFHEDDDAIKASIAQKICSKAQNVI